MKHSKLIFTATLLLSFAFSAFSQRRVGGKVIDVLDGKTAVVKMSNGSSLTVVLQYIEIPEYDQSLNQTVKDHLKKLIINQTVDVNPRGVKDGKTIGQMTLNGVDISQQMIRDGAAWYAILEKNGQPASQSLNYQSQEALAKSEQRGVWSDEKMIPAWEFRVAREEARKQAEKDALEKIKREAVEARALNDITEAPKSYRIKKQELLSSDQIMWANPNIDFSDIPDEKGLVKFKVPEFDKEITMTSSAFYDIVSGNEKRRFECRTMYLGEVSGKELLSIAFVTKSETKNLRNSSNLTIEADGKKFNLGKAFRQEKKDGKLTDELLIYYFDMDTFTSIAIAKKVKFTLAEYSAEMTPKSHEFVKNLYLRVIKK